MKFYEIEKLEMDAEVRTQAWIRYVRKASSVLFLQCYDGTSVSDIQMVITKNLSPDLK